MKSEAKVMNGGNGGRKAGAYNIGSMTSRVDALSKGEVLLFAHDDKTIAQCRHAVKTVEANDAKARFEVLTLHAYDSANVWRMKLIKVERLK